MGTEGGRGPVGRNGQKLAIGPAPQRQPRVLVLEDQKEIRELIIAMAKMRGCICEEARLVAEARKMMEQARYDLLLLDVQLPDGSGLDLARGAGPDAPLLLVITGMYSAETAIAALRGRAIDFITKPFNVEGFLRSLDAALDEWRSRGAVAHYARALETLVSLKSDELSRTNRQMDEVQDMAVAALGAALGLKDHETEEHCVRVSENSVRLGAALGLSPYELRNLRWSSYLHDVGKIGIPEQILLKPGQLTAAERRVMEKHPKMGYDLIRGIGFLADATDVVIAHHEWYDGTGYPSALALDRIPLSARIFAVMDALDAMTSDRPYRAARPFREAVAELRSQAGSQFDPEIVKAFEALPAETWLIQGGELPPQLVVAGDGAVKGGGKG